MQHVICVKWSADNKYILSGSDEMNIRLWKANAAEKLGVVSPTLSLLFFALYHTKDNLPLKFPPNNSSPRRLRPVNSSIFLSYQTYCISLQRIT